MKWIFFLMVMMLVMIIFYISMYPKTHLAEYYSKSAVTESISMLFWLTILMLIMYILTTDYQQLLHKYMKYTKLLMLNFMISASIIYCVIPTIMKNVLKSLNSMFLFTLLLLIWKIWFTDYHKLLHNCTKSSLSLSLDTSIMICTIYFLIFNSMQSITGKLPWMKPGLLFVSGMFSIIYTFTQIMLTTVQTNMKTYTWMSNMFKATTPVLAILTMQLYMNLLSMDYSKLFKKYGRVILSTMLLKITIMPDPASLEPYFILAELLPPNEEEMPIAGIHFPITNYPLISGPLFLPVFPSTVMFALNAPLPNTVMFPLWAVPENGLMRKENFLFFIDMLRMNQPIQVLYEVHEVLPTKPSTIRCMLEGWPIPPFK